MMPINKNIYERVMLNAGRNTAKVPLSNFVYANASARILLATPTGYTPQMASFAANNPAYCTIGGRTFVQVERSVQNIQPYSNRADLNARYYWLSCAYITDPAGGATAQRISETAVNNVHCFDCGALDAVTNRTRVFSAVIGKSSNRWASCSVGTGAVRLFSHFNPVTGTWGTKNAAHTGHFIIDLGSWWFVGFRVTAAVHNYVGIGLSPDGGVTDTYLGDVSKFIDVWQVQYQEAYYPTSPISTAATAVTRNADVLYIPVALRSRINIPFSLWAVPRFSNAQRVLAATSAYLIDQYIDATHGVQLYIDGSSNLVLDIDGASSFTQALTYSADSMLKFTVNPTTGAVTVLGATTGDGTYGSTPFTFAAGADIYWGGRYDGTLQGDSLISLPY